MNEETFKKILSLILKVTIKNSGFLSQLEIFRDVRFLMNQYFSIKESDLLVKIGQGKNEDFKDILNFILTILCELALVSQKMENKSFYFKWNGFKGFRKKYLLDIISNKSYTFDISESFEHRVQIYTRLLLINLFNNNTGITTEQLDEIMKKCSLENQNRHTDKIHSILKFLDFIVKENNTDKYTSSHQIFTLLTKDNSQILSKNDQIIFRIDKSLMDENLIKDINYAEKYFLTFNEFLSNKISQWNEEIMKNSQGCNPHSNPFNEDIIMKDDSNYLDKVELNELDQYKVNISNFNTDNEEIGFAVLRGNNWSYYIKKLYCIIGRVPMKFGVAFNSTKNEKYMLNSMNENYGNTAWHVDVDLGQNCKISKQHALIAFNFQTGSFEIQNLSKKHNIKVNGEALKFGEEMPLSSKSLISISSQEFYFLLPLDK